jgi:5-methylthioadenosine/S-adenosylhomocysteine deaminase
MRPICNKLLPLFFLALTTAATNFGQTPQKEAVSYDLLVKNATILTMDGDRHIIEDGVVAVRGDSIEFVGSGAKFLAMTPKGVTARQTIDAKGKLVLPGFINGHGHAAMTLFRGLHDDVTLDDWLRKYIFPAEAKNVTEDFVRWGTRLAAAEQIRDGITTFADMYYFEDAVAEETKAAGMRGVLGETFIDFPAPDNKTNAAMLAYTEKFLKRWQGDPLIHAAAAPHSIYTCSKQTLQDAAALARKYNAPILIHVAEMKKELDDSRAANGTTPVQYLDKIGILGPDVLAAHCIFVDETDRKLLAAKQVGCVHNPSSNMMLASGVSPVPELRAAGVAVGLGTDGVAGSNNDLDLMEEMDLAAKLQKITKMDPRALGAKDVVEMATIEGAKALHMDKEIGSLEPGKKADLIVMGLDAPNAVPIYDLYSQLAYSLKANDIETVVIGGRIVMRDKKLLTVDEPAAIAKAREYQKKIANSLGMGNENEAAAPSSNSISSEKGAIAKVGVGGVSPPTCIKCPGPKYSQEALAAKYQGTVTLIATVTLEGRATHIMVVKGPGMGLEERAIAAVGEWKFHPAKDRNGNSVAAVIPIEVTFRLRH